MKKYKVKIREIIEHTFEVEEFNEYMAGEAARELLKEVQRTRIPSKVDSDIQVEEINPLLKTKR